MNNEVVKVRDLVAKLWNVEESPEDSLDAMLFRQAFREGFAQAKKNPNANIEELINTSSVYKEVLEENV